MARISFSQFSSHDLEELSHWVQQYFGHDGLTYNSSVKSGIQSLLDHPEYGVAWRIEVDHKGVGYCVLTYGFDYEVGGRTAVITDLFLLEEARGQGVGTATLTHCVEHARSMGISSLELCVLNHNKRARALYERFGFAGSNDRQTISCPV